MSFGRKLFRYFSLNIWGGLPRSFQRWLSRVYAGIYDWKFSRHLIGPYCKISYDDPAYLKKFKPASGKPAYQSFQDFFTRVLREPLNITEEACWACEGILCEYGRIAELPEVHIKGQTRHVRHIFGNSEIPDDYYFSNVFLHNADYHRIHAPAVGSISRIEHVPGDLVILRPWIYDKDPSIPALRNERINIDLVTERGKWFLSIIGGPAVGSIVMNDSVALNRSVNTGDELAVFLLGSTCCIAAPVPARHSRVGEPVAVGQPL